MGLFDFIPGYETAIVATGREPAFVMLLAFILTYIGTRGYTRIARVTGWGSASFGGVHTHHMVFGLVMAFFASAAVFAFTPSVDSLFFLFLAALFGSGASLVLDEFALIFHLKDVYWEEEGRKSVDAVVLGVVFGLLFLLHVAPFGSGPDSTGGYLAAAIIINLPLVIIAALKGKIFFAIFGVFIPTLAMVGALRLAEPDSAWSKKFYSTKPKKLNRSKERYASYEARLRPVKEAVWDFIGGKTGRPVATNRR